MTIAGAFWVGVLAARRLRDWGDGRRALEDADAPLALAPGGVQVLDEPAARRVRARVAERLGATMARGALPPASTERTQDLGLETLRVGDVISVDGAPTTQDCDYVVEGIVRMREGATTGVVACVADGESRRWIVGAVGQDELFVLEPVVGHGLAGEPPRNVDRGPRSYALERRGQATAAGTGRHGRPDGSRVSTYVYRAGGGHVLWLERWGSEVVMGEGSIVPAHAVSFLPGS